MLAYYLCTGCLLCNLLILVVPLPTGYKSVAHYLVLSNLAGPGEAAAPDVADSSAAASVPAVTEPVQAAATGTSGMHIGPTQEFPVCVNHTYMGDPSVKQWLFSIPYLAKSTLLWYIAVAVEAAAVEPPQEDESVAAASPTPKTGASPAATLRQAHIDTILLKAKQGASKAGAGSKAKLAKPTGWASSTLNFSGSCQRSNWVQQPVQQGAAAVRVLATATVNTGM